MSNDSLKLVELTDKYSVCVSHKNYSEFTFITFKQTDFTVMEIECYRTK